MQPGASFRLTVRRGPQPNQQYHLTREIVTIGRDITNDVVVNDPEVSRHHARLVRTATGYTVEDLRSTNGTFVNRQRVTAPAQLTNGDLIGVGETVTLVYEVSGEAAPTAPSISREPAVAPRPEPLGQPPMAQMPMAPPMPEFEEEEDFEPDRNRWIVIGCGVLTLLFCCALIAALIFVDQWWGREFWCQLPIFSGSPDCVGY